MTQQLAGELENNVDILAGSYAARNEPYWKRNLAICVFGSFTTLVSLTLLLPFLPRYVQQLGVTSKAAVYPSGKIVRENSWIFAVFAVCRSGVWTVDPWTYRWSFGYALGFLYDERDSSCRSFLQPQSGATHGLERLTAFGI